MINKVICGDSLKKLKKLATDSVNLIFADPPYNLQLKKELFRPDKTKVNGVTENWDKFQSFAEYDDFSSIWLKECRRILKSSGSIWVIGSYHNIFRLGKIMQDLGLWILNDVIWAKSNPMPNFKGVRLTNAHETLIWAAKDENAKYFFNYQQLKILNDDKQMRSVWELPICSGKERIKNHNNEKAHPTQKPISLITRIILGCSQEKSLVLAPFLGSGTTACVAKQFGRNYIGIEQNPEYIKIISQRLKETKLIANLEFKIPLKSTQRVSLMQLLEVDFISTQQKLLSVDKKYEATICADGCLIYKDYKNSLHKVAEYLNQEKTNGW